MVFIAANMKDAAMHLENMIPVKKYDGKKSSNSTILTLVLYLYKRVLGVDDVREIVKNDFLNLTPTYS